VRCRIALAIDLCRHLLSEVGRKMLSIDEVRVDANDAKFLSGPEEGRAPGDFESVARISRRLLKAGSADRRVSGAEGAEKKSARRERRHFLAAGWGLSGPAQIPVTDRKCDRNGAPD